MKNKIILLLSSGMLCASGQIREDLVSHMGSFLEYGADTNSLDATCRTAHKALEPKQVELEALKAIKEDFTTNPDLLEMTKSLRALPLSDEIKTWFVQKVINSSKETQKAFVSGLRTEDYVNQATINSRDEDIHWLFARLNDPRLIEVNWFHHAPRYNNREPVFLGHCALTLPTSKQKYDFMSTIANWAMPHCYISFVFRYNLAILQELRTYTPDNPNEHVDEAIRKLSQNLD